MTLLSTTTRTGLPAPNPARGIVADSPDPTLQVSDRASARPETAQGDGCGKGQSVLPAVSASSVSLAPRESRALARRRELVQDENRDLTAAARATKNERLLFCRQVHALVAQGHTQAAAVMAVATRAEEFPILLTAGHGESSALTLHNYRRWMQRLGKHGNGRPNWDNHLALADRYGLSVREPGGDPRVWRDIATLYLHPNQRTLTECYRIATYDARRAGIRELPSFDQVQYWYSHKADRAAVAVARLGEDWARNSLLDYIRRDPALISVGELWYGDHHLFDALVKIGNPEGGGFRAVRPWLTAWMDFRSHYFVGIVIRAGESPDSLAIEDALLQGIRANGNVPPLVIGKDNGKDYSSLGFCTPVTTPDGHRHAIIQELGCKVTTAIAYNPRSKPIERVFRDICTGFSKWWAAYVGNRPGNRPAAAEHYWKNPDLLPSLQQFTEAFALWLREFYHAQAGGESKATGGRSPSDLWNSRQPLRPALTDAQLFLAFLKPVQGLRLVGRGGCVRWANQTYQSEALFDHWNREILIKVDRFNPLAHLYCYTPDGKLICEAKAPRTLPHLAGSDAERQAIGDEQRRIRKQLTRARTIIHTYTGGAKAISPLDRVQIAQGEPPALPPADIFPADSASSPGFPSSSTPTRSGASLRAESAATSDPATTALLERLLAGHDTEETTPAPGSQEQAAHAGEEDARLLRQLLKEDPSHV